MTKVNPNKALGALALLLFCMSNNSMAYVLFPYESNFPVDGLEFELNRTSFGNDAAFAERAVIMAIDAWATSGNIDIELSLSPDDPLFWDEAEQDYFLDPLPRWKYKDREDGRNVIYFGRTDGPMNEEWDDMCFNPEALAYAHIPVNSFTPHGCDIVVCDYRKYRDIDENGVYNHIVNHLIHEIGHCLGIAHNSDTSTVMYPFNHTALYPTVDEYDALRDLATGYQFRENRIRTSYTNNLGDTWIQLSYDAGFIENASHRKVSVAPKVDQGRYAMVYTDIDARVRVAVGDGNHSYINNNHTGGWSINGAGIAWKPNGRMIVVYRTKHNGKLYSRYSDDEGGSWGMWSLVNNTVASGNVDAAYDVYNEVFLAVEERTTDGMIMLSSSVDGETWESVSLSQDVYSIGGYAISCPLPGDAAPICTIAFADVEDFNTKAMQIVPIDNTTYFVLSNHDFTDGVYSTGQVDIGVINWDDSIGMYSHRAHWSPDANSHPWGGSFFGLTGSTKYWYSNTNWADTDITYGSYWNEFLRTTSYTP